MHEVAARGFDSEASVYDRARPSYPPDAVAWVTDQLAIASLPRGARVADVGAGTGIFTRLLLPSCATAGARLLAVEPVAGMRALLAASLPEVPMLAGTAEALPLRAGSVAAITVAQAFHWFDTQTAFAELSRVLRPCGRLALLWNSRDRTQDWTDRLWAIVDAVETEAPWGAPEVWHRHALVDTPYFQPPRAATFHHEQRLTAEDVVARIRSVSHVAVLPDDERAAVLDNVRDLLRTHPDTVGRTELALPYRVDAYCAAPR